MQYGEKITELRKSHGMTQADLGKKLNVTFQAVSKWERDESIPDFETLSKIARLFGVPITYFEDEQPQAAEEEALQPAPVVDNRPVMLGVCKQCGRVVNEGDEAQTQPVLICKDCQARMDEEKREAEKAAREAREKHKRDEELFQRAQKAGYIRYRNRGLIWGAVITAVVLAILIACCVTDKANTTAYVVSIVFFAVCGYTYFTQLFWDGLIRDMTLFGGKIVGMPGVIFTLDLDGMLFLIGVKILFALLKMLIFIVTLLIAVFIAMIVSPFSFVPQMIKCGRGDLS